jgi:hypothetical protein
MTVTLKGDNIAVLTETAFKDAGPNYVMISSEVL